MQKLIKIAEDHYIVIGKLETEEIGVFVFDDDYEPPLIYKTCEEFFRIGKQGYKITHSFGKELEGVENRPLSEAQEIECGYCVEKITEQKYPIPFPHKFSNMNQEAYKERNAYIEGFNAYKELVKDKIVISKHKLEDILYALLNCEKYEDGTFSFTGADQYKIKKTSSSLVRQFIQPLLPPTEWEIEFVNGKIKLLK